MKKLTYEDVKNYIESHGYKLVSTEYKNNSDKLITICPNGNIYKVSYNKFKQNRRCLCCRKKEMELEHKVKVDNTGEYKHIKSYFAGDILPNRKVAKVGHMMIEHLYCKNKYLIQTTNFINVGQKCSRCCGSYENSFAHHIEQELGLKLEDVWDFEKNTVNPYHISKNAHEKVWLKCQKEEINELNGLVKKNYHKNYEIGCDSFSQGIRCSYCKPSGKNPKVHPYDSFGYHHFDKVLSWHPDNDISPFRVARNSNKKYKFICCECGNIFYTYVCNINTQNSWCPECSMSEGENIISNWLRYNGIKYEYEKTYEGLVGINGGSLSYDFYLYEYNLLIEYQGRQHDKYIEGLHSSHFEFERQQEHDKRKREYAKDNNIKLLEIWYYDFDKIEEILNKELNL